MTDARMPSSRCKQCNEPLVEIDHWGERPDLPAKPHDIPSSPYSHYGDEFRARGGLAAWLGRRNVAQRHPLATDVAKTLSEDEALLLGRTRAAKPTPDCALSRCPS